MKAIVIAILMSMLTACCEKTNERYECKPDGNVYRLTERGIWVSVGTNCYYEGVHNDRSGN